MTRSLIPFLALAFLVGCGESTSTNIPAPTANNGDTSVTMSRPADVSTGPVSMKDFSDQSGLKIYPGSESGKGEGFKRADGIIKDIMTFTTADSVDRIAEFYKGEGMDVKTKTMPIGTTKSGAQIMVMVSAVKEGNQVKITALIEPKK